jgi:hypothetical protein
MVARARIGTTTPRDRRSSALCAHQQGDRLAFDSIIASADP